MAEGAAERRAAEGTGMPPRAVRDAAETSSDEDSAVDTAAHDEASGEESVGLVSSLWMAARSVFETLGLAGSEAPPQTTGAGRLGTAGSSPAASRISSFSLANSASRSSAGALGARANVTLLARSDYDVALEADARPHTSERDVIVTQALIEALHGAVPARFRLTATWRLLYSTAEHGFSLATLYARCREHDGATLLALRDDGGAVFGVCATEAWRPHLGHYGDGESFLWRAVESPADAAFLATVAPHACAGDVRAVRFGPTGANAHYMISETTFLASGCSDGRFALWVDEQLLHGQSEATATFGNPSLASMPSFTVLNVELWGIERPAHELF